MPEEGYRYVGDVASLGLTFQAVVGDKWQGSPFWLADVPLRSDWLEHPDVEPMEVVPSGISAQASRVRRLVKKQLAPVVTFAEPQLDEEHDRWCADVLMADGQTMPERVNINFVRHIEEVVGDGGTWHWILRNAGFPDFLAYVVAGHMRGLVMTMDEADRDAA